MVYSTTKIPAPSRPIKQQSLAEASHQCLLVKQQFLKSEGAPAQALLTVADTCSNTGRFPPEEALQAARRRYELARGRLQSGSSTEQGDSPTRTSDLFATPRASPRASRPGVFGGVSKLTAQQRRARHRCNNPWYDLPLHRQYHQ